MVSKNKKDKKKDDKGIVSTPIPRPTPISSPQAYPPLSVQPQPAYYNASGSYSTWGIPGLNLPMSESEILADFLKMQIDDVENDDVLEIINNLGIQRALRKFIKEWGGVHSHINAADMVTTVQYFMDSKYPKPNEQVITSMNSMTLETKDYWLPALKVLNRDKNGVFWSPSRVAEWADDELTATHVGGFMQVPHETVAKWRIDDDGNRFEDLHYCECGIYASVNVSELYEYAYTPSMSIELDSRFPKEARRLCIIEPFSDAHVWIARKGWKADRAFVSEIVGETISVENARFIMSMTWNRDVDIPYILEGFKK